MEYLERDLNNIHFENLRREAESGRFLKRAGLTSPSLVERAIPGIGDMLIRAGMEIKSHSTRRLTSEQVCAIIPDLTATTQFQWIYYTLSK
jgi:hypothetical protein